MPAAPVTLLFTDLVDSTALLQRVGDERAQRVLHAHRQLLREALASHGGREVKWLGDGVLTAFASVADGVRCAVTMAQRARRPVAGERLGLRVGVHVGEVLADEDDYAGTPVVLARRLCDRAAAGQILCSGVVVELLRGRQGFDFAAVGALALKGFAEPVAGHEGIRRAEALGVRLANGSKAAPDTSAPAAPTFDSDAAGVFRREGDVWAVTWAGTTVRLRDARGFAYLAVLLRHPDRELHATDVVRLATGDDVGDSPRTRADRELVTSADLGHAGTILDPRARDAYRTRLADLREELAEAEGSNDLGRTERLGAEIDALVQQLAGAARGRTAKAHGERARLAVTKGIKSALERIAASHPELGRHLAATVRRGYFCVYRPDPARPVRWET